MKMKKIGYICMAMVLTFALLGIGYSMWSQTVVITGNVNTGTVAFNVSAPTGQWEWKDETLTGTNAAQVYVTQGPVSTSLTAKVNYISTNPLIPIGSGGVPSGILFNGGSSGDSVVLIGAAYTVITAGPPQTVTVNYVNMFPLNNGTGPWIADFTLTNTSSIPVMWHAVLSGVTGTNMGNLTGPTITFGANNTVLNGTQWDPTSPNAALTVNVSIIVPDNNNAQGITGSFTYTIQAVQWNEFSGAVIQ
jgi:hypothetical protein